MATEIARQAKIEIADLTIRENLINLLETIIVYKLPHKSREEIAAMFSSTDLKQTKFYQEVFTEGVQEGRDEERKILIQRLVGRGISFEEIAQMLDISVGEVEAIATQAEQN